MAISAIFLWLAMRGLKLQEVAAALRVGNYSWLIPSVATYFVAVWARTWRWDYMLRPLKHIPVRRLFPVVVIGYMGNNIYPFRAGEVLRSYVLRHREQVPMSASLATVIVERVFDGLVMLIFVFFALPFAPLPSDSIRLVVIIASIAFFGAMAVFFALAVMPERAMRLAVWFSSRFVPGRFRGKVLGMTARFLDGLESLRSFRNVMMIFLTSIIIWLLETGQILVCHARLRFPGQLLRPDAHEWDGQPGHYPARRAPGYVGTFDAPGIAVLVLYGVREELAAAYTLVLHAALWLPVTLLGIYYMFKEQLGWSDFARAQEIAEGEVTV
jgi:glycosyltransferase 2 family protein